jgi:3-oxoacyl-[acyl-carrier-protein] synthase-3
MGTRIEAAVTARHKWLRSSLRMTDKAARKCLACAHRDASEIDLLVNTGIYRDLSAAEPALAAIIQEDIGANPGTEIDVRHHGTFSFDLVAGGCGVVQAARLADAFVGQGNARYAMIVAGDADPSPTTTCNFPFTPVGGAMLLGHVDGTSGFHAFRTRTYPEYAPLFESRLRWDPRAGLLGRGRNVVEFVEAPEFAPRCIDAAIDVARELLADEALAASDIDVLVASQYPHTFAAAVARGLGIPEDRAPSVSHELIGSHTAGPIAALEAATSEGRFASARRVLFVTAGAGITIAGALYHRL